MEKAENPTIKTTAAFAAANQAAVPAQRPHSQDEDTIDLLEIFYLLLAHWKMIFLAMLIGATLLGAYCTFMLKSSYQTNASIYITNTDSVISFSDLQLSAALTEDYAKIIQSRTVLNRVIDELELNLNYRQLDELIDVANPDSTHIVEITVTCSDPELARNITNALTSISVNQIYQIIGSSMPTVIDFSAAESVNELAPSLKKYLAMGAMLGALLVCGILVVRKLLDTTLKTEEDIEKYLGLPVLASVPHYNE